MCFVWQLRGDPFIPKLFILPSVIHEIAVIHSRDVIEPQKFVQFNIILYLYHQERLLTMQAFQAELLR